MHWWYDSIIDWMLANPDKNKRDCAAAFDVTPTWIYNLTNSDTFRTAYELRREQHSVLLSSGIINKATAVTEMVLDELQVKLEEKRSELTLPFLRDTADTLLQRIGYTGKANQPAGPAAQVLVQIGLTPEELADSRRRMLEAGEARTSSAPEPLRPAPALPQESPEPPMIEATAVEVHAQAAGPAPEGAPPTAARSLLEDL